MESISRISSLLETARDLTLEAARDVGPRRSTRPLPAQQIKKLLDSRNEREVMDGLRKVIAMQYADPPQPTLTFFPSVVKTLSNPNPSARPLIYTYLLHHAASDPDTALLSINTIQKSLSDSNPRVRALALKTMSGIQVSVISQIVSLAIKKGVSDPSPLVRKAAALACIKCVRLDSNTRPQVEEYLAILLADKQYYVAGAAVQAFAELCPEKLALIHPVYRRLCRMIVDMDEWGQLALLRVIVVYARRCFPRRTKLIKRAAAATTQEQRAKDFYEDLDTPGETAADFEEVDVIDPDLELFLRSVKQLLSSRNSAVVVAVAKAYLCLSPATYLPNAVGPLVALLRSSSDIQYVALHNIVQICLISPSSFVSHYRHFLLRRTDAPQITTLKLEMLTLIFPHSASTVQSLILAELEHFSTTPSSSELVRAAVRAIGQCAQSSPPSTSSSHQCLALLLKQIHSHDSNLVGEAMQVIRHLIQREPEHHSKTIVLLAKNLDTLKSSTTARASIVWLAGEFAAADSTTDGIAADVLRILVKGYADESEEVQGQIVLLAAKVYLRFLNAKTGAAGTSPLPDTSEEASHERDTTEPDPIEQLYDYTMLLARYTVSYKVRDRARLLRALLAIPSSTELASLLLLAPKPVPYAPSPGEARKDFLLGSTSLVVGSEGAGAGGVHGHNRLPEWVEEGMEPDSSLRDEGESELDRGSKDISGRSVAAGSILDEALRKEDELGVRTGKKVKAKTLDDWLDEEDDEDDDDDEDDIDDDQEDESSEEDEDESSESYLSEDEDDESDEDDEQTDAENSKRALLR